MVKINWIKRKIIKLIASGNGETIQIKHGWNRKQIRKIAKIQKITERINNAVDQEKNNWKKEEAGKINPKRAQMKHE